MARRKQDPECICGSDIWELADENGYRECAMCGEPHPHNPGGEDLEDDDPPDDEPSPQLWDRSRRDYEREYWPDDRGEDLAVEAEW